MGLTVVRRGRFALLPAIACGFAFGFTELPQRGRRSNLKVAPEDATSRYSFTRRRLPDPPNLRVDLRWFCGQACYCTCGSLPGYSSLVRAGLFKLRCRG